MYIWTNKCSSTVTTLNTAQAMTDRFGNILTDFGLTLINIFDKNKLKNYRNNPCCNKY